MDPQLWTKIFGHQFENLVLNHRNRLLELLNIDPIKVVWDNPFLQIQSKRRKGCQVDYLVQTRDRNLYLCEIKFSSNPVNSSEIKEVETKIQALALPRGYSVRPILIHINGVSPSLVGEEYFASVIDFAQFLESP